MAEEGFIKILTFYRTSKSVSIWILLQGDEYSQRLEFILDDDLEVKLNIESGVEIFESITNGRKIVKLPPLSSGNNCVIFSGLTPHRPSRGGERISIDFRINSFSNIFEVSLFFLNYFFVISIIKIKIFIKYIIFNLIKFNKF